MYNVVRRRFLTATTVLAVGLASNFSAQAQTTDSYPSKPITLVVPFGVGGATDLGARIFANGLSEEIGQPIIVQNKPGGAGTIGAEYVAKAAPDGYTLLWVGGGSMLQSLFSHELRIDLRRDLTPVVQLFRGQSFLNVRGDLPVKDVHEFLDLIKKDPGKYNYASLAVTQMLPMEMLLHRAQAKMEHISYGNLGQIIQAFVAKDIVASVAGPAGYEPVLQTGQARQLMVFGDERSPHAPDVPSAAELGFPGLHAPFSFAVWAPTNTDPAIVDKVNAAFNKVLKREDAQEFVRRQTAVIAGGPPQVHSDHIAAEHAYWEEAVRISGYIPK